MTDRDEMGRDDTDHGLDALLALARVQAPAPGDALMARLLADAEAARPAPRPVAPVPAAPRPPSRPWSLSRALGGWPALGTLAASTALGVTVGMAQPASLPDFAGTVATAVWGEGMSVGLGLDEDPLSLLEG